MDTPWIRFLIVACAATALLSLAVLEMITARPRIDYLLTGVGQVGDEGRGTWLDSPRFDAGDRR